jgi:DNA-binding NarL/FixJ family response regulator
MQRPHLSALVVRAIPPHLTPRERQIVELIAQGYDTKQIAELLELAPASVDTRVQGLFRKYGVNRRAALVWVALAGGPRSTASAIPGPTRPPRRRSTPGR